MATFADSDKKLSVIEQYADALYSDFVEAHDNAAMFTEYHHYTFFNAIKSFLQDSSVDESFRVLDIGCGNGIVGRKVNALNSKISVVGVDMSSSMLAKARHFSSPADKFRYVEANALHLPSDLGLFNAVLSGYFFAHLETRFDVFKAFSNIADHLVAGGVTCNLVPGSPQGMKEGEIVPVFLPGPSGAIRLYDTYWSMDTYMEAAAAAGLVDVQLRPCEMSKTGKELNLDSSDFKSFVVYARKPL